MLKLPEVTLIAVDTGNPDRVMLSIQKSTLDVEFGAVKLITSDKFADSLEDWNTVSNCDIEIDFVNNVNSIEDYSRFCLKEMHKHFYTNFCLIIQHDSWVVNPDAWTQEFLKYDYIGAVWRWLYHAHRDTFGNPCGKVYQGNGGFSFRSKRLLESVAFSDVVQKFHPEDGWLCTVYDEYFKGLGFNWAPFELCDKFSIESLPYYNFKSFGHHNGMGVPNPIVRIPQRMKNGNFR
jgi:hypothetical protein